MEVKQFIDNIKFDDKGLVAAVAQDYKTNEVLMVAYMNREAVEITLNEKRACYFSRSRNCLWRKGETSGHVQHLKGMYYDCDGDAVLMKVEQVGAACHTGAYSCFFNKMYEDGVTDQSVINKVYNQIINRRDNPQEGSYTNYLFDKGLDKILKKCGEECTEVCIAAKNGDNAELINEISDLLYHVTVLMVQQGVSVENVMQELERRSNKIGNLKKFHVTDKNT